MRSYHWVDIFFLNAQSLTCAFYHNMDFRKNAKHLMCELTTEWIFGSAQSYFALTFTFTFMHLADAFIQSDLHCIQVTVSTFYQLLLSLGIEPMILALLTPCSTS